jgi:hypothetical protein
VGIKMIVELKKVTQSNSFRVTPELINRIHQAIEYSANAAGKDFFAKAICDHSEQGLAKAA